MSVTTVPAHIDGSRPDTTSSTTTRLVLVAIAIAVLLAVSFVVGRVTASTSSNTSIVPVAHTSGADSCPHFHFC